MQLAAFACVRDERDIVEPFVRHTLAFAAHLFLIDHGSSDGTSEVLASLRDEGLPLTVLRDDSLGNDQAARMSRLLKLATEKSPADWYLPLDADEFVQFGPNSADALREFDPARPILLRWRGYVPHETDDSGQANPVLRIRHRRELPAWEDSKVLIPRTLAVQEGVRLRQGSHGILVHATEVAPTEQPYVNLAHFPVRSPEQFLAKMTIRALQYRLTPNRNPASGWGFDAALARALRDPATLAAEFAVAAARYGLAEGFRDTIPLVDDPVDYRGGPLKFSPPPQNGYAFRSLLAFAAQVSAAPREIVRQPEMTEAALQRERLLRDQCVAIRRLELHVRAVESERNAAKVQALACAELPAALRRSWTWRVGRCLVGPVASLRAAARRLFSPREAPQKVKSHVFSTRVRLHATGKEFPRWHSADRQSDFNVLKPIA